jgi:hypothetical protein
MCKKGTVYEEFHVGLAVENYFVAAVGCLREL